jgi:hypothetical protein
MSTNLLGELAANNGTFYLSGGSVAISLPVDQVIVRGNSISFIELYQDINGVETPVTLDYMFQRNQIFPNGLRITPKNGAIFTRIYCEGANNGSGLELVLAS